MKKSILCALLGCAMVAAAGLDARGAVAFGPGKVSKFTVSGVGSGVLVGASGVTWANFSSTDYYGTKVFVNQGIVDAEKTAANDADDLWCYHISDMDALFLTGWSKKTSFSNVDAMKAHFNGDTIRKMSGGVPVEGTYGFVRNDTWGDLLYWYKNASGIDLASRGALTEGTIGSSFASTLKSLMDDGGHVVRVNVFFSTVLRNKRWNTTDVSIGHGVLCVGYVANGNVLKALFLIDPDNDQFTGSGGTSAPNSVMYCPVSWNSGSYTISGVWGQDGVLLSEYRALAVLKESTPSPTPSPAGTYTVRFSACGGTGKMAAQKLAVDASAALRKNAFKRSGWTFLGWAKSKNGKVAYKNAATVKNLAANGGTVTLYAKWAKSSYKVKFVANGGKGKMAAQKFAYGKAKKLSKNKFNRSGWTFLGWAKSKSGKVAYKNAAAVKNLTAKGGTVPLYAKWAKTSYKVAFDANGGQGKMSAQKMTYGKAKKLSANKFTRKGYDFLGWAKSKTGTVAYKDQAAVKNLVANGKTVKLYAAWKKKASSPSTPSSYDDMSYLVLFDANGGTGQMYAQDFDHDESKALAENLYRRPGYVFAGWATTPGGAAVYADGQVVRNLSSGAAVWLYAVWKTNTANPAVSLFFCGLNFVTESKTAWSATTENGKSALGSAAAGGNGPSTLYLTVTGPGTLSFKMSTAHGQSDDGCLTFIHPSGSTSLTGQGAFWLPNSVEILSGTHVLTWTHEKGANSGSARGYIADVVWTPSR